ncbi:MAG: hypothetical protein RL021_2272, partial [Bacteroidota bacterium]
YQAEKGDVSKVFTFGDKYVIGRLTDIREKGILPLDAVRDQVTIEARKMKKGEMLIEKIQGASGKSIDELAQKLNSVAADADNVSFMNGYIMGIGNEPKVTGNIFGMKQGQLSKAIAGDNGVCVVFVKSFTEPAAVKDYSESMNQMRDQRRQRSEYEVQAALKEVAAIEDNRGRFY